MAESLIEITRASSHEMTTSLVALVKCAIAIALFVIGAVVQYFYFEGLDNDDDCHALNAALINSEPSSSAHS